MENQLDSGYNSTIVMNYTQAMEVMDYSDNVCGCCKMDSFEDWYKTNEAYFVKKGVFLMDDLLQTEKETLRYCFLFDFENKEESHFTVINYYNREKIISFKSERTGDWRNPKITIDYFDKKKFKDFGRFTNSIIQEKIKKQLDLFLKRNSSLPDKKFKEEIKKFEDIEDKMIAQFMCEHTFDMVQSSFFYFTLEKPEQIEYKEFIIEQKEETEITSRTSGKVVKYYYTGYVNLNQTKIYRTKNLSDNLKKEKEKRGQYQRHIEKWTVRGHYRTVNGKKIWIEPQIRGIGNTIENRIYGISPESDINLVPKVFEVTRTEKIVEAQKVPEPLQKVSEQKLPIEKPKEAPKRLSIWEKIIIIIKKIFKL